MNPMRRFLTNWRTSLAAVVIGGSLVAQYAGVITPEQRTSIIGVAAMAGLARARDDKDPNPNPPRPTPAPLP